MRDLVIVAIVIAAALMALKRPWIGVMLWTWLSIMIRIVIPGDSPTMRRWQRLQLARHCWASFLPG